ncbi:MAG: ScyD/ScyE family protein [Opitutus sp.]
MKLFALLTSLQPDAVGTLPLGVFALGVRRSTAAKLSRLLLILGLAGTAIAQTSPNVSPFAHGLNNPRGLKFGPDGNLYVAEGGAGGDISSAGQAVQVVPHIGPYTGGYTARISKITPNGTITTVVDGLPSSQTSDESDKLVSGVADVAFVGHTLYAILAVAGASHGLVGTNNGVLRVNPDGSTTFIANLSDFQKSHPTAVNEDEDFEPDGTWYSMIAVRGALYAVEPNHGELVVIDPVSGKINRVADISASQGHSVPTAVAYDGNFYVGNLRTFPIVEGSSKILKITPSGQVKVYATGFTTVVGLAFDGQHRLYVLENTTGEGNLFPTPFTGKISRIEHSGKVVEIATGLFLPTAMTFGPDGNLYVSNIGFGPPPIGLGEIVKVTIP